MPKKMKNGIESAQAIAKRCRSKPLKEKPAPTEKKARAIAASRLAYDGMPARPSFEAKCRPDGALVLDARHNDEQGESYLLHAATGSASDAWVNHAVKDLAKVGGARGVAGVTSAEVNAGLAFLSGVEPGDEVEAALGVQMYATHQLAVEMASLCRHTNDRAALMEYGNMATKMMRTFAMQVDALAKIRRGGEQVVRHVHVYEGGQAIVVDQFNHHGAGNGKAFGQPYAPFAGHAPAFSAPMLSQDAAGNGVPVSSDQGQKTMPHARRKQPRRASRKPE
ncbi:hypothetical protein FHS54_001451 [Sphingobium vermicomposti]|uniref:Uncharacterized protein n=1 Tax=Sphingobium vermicomposti TaxID=529005 RepID=A0A846MF62_9SPHN|nr:hypothetical protein [Sphingobium vermicomposti]